MASNVASSHPPLSSLASQVSPAPAQGPGSTQRQFGRFIPNGFSLAGSRLPRARPSSAGSTVKHRFTFDFGGFDVLAPPPLLPPLASQVSPALAQGSGSTQRRSGRSNPDAFSLAGSRLPRARPSSTGSKVEHRSTFDFGGFAVPAATLKSMRRPPKPVLKSILKRSTATMIPCGPASVCAGPIDFSGRGLCRASAEVYAAPWRSLPAQEWDNDKLPIEISDRYVTPRPQIEKGELLADEERPIKVGFAQPLISRRRIVSRWIPLVSRWI